MAYKISDSCVACGTCIDECPVEAISAGDIYVIDPSKCIDCGTCAGKNVISDDKYYFVKSIKEENGIYIDCRISLDKSKEQRIKSR